MSKREEKFVKREVVQVAPVVADTPVAETKVETQSDPVVLAQGSPVVPDPVPAAAAPAITPTQQAAIDKIMESARSAAQQILLSAPLATLGTPSGNVEDTQDTVQRDRLPGSMRKDKTYVPEYIYDEHEGVTRRALRNDVYKYALVLTSIDNSMDTIQNYLEMGYKHVMYDGGSRSGLEERGFKGTGDAIFRRTIEGYCQRGDCRLMYIPMRGWEAIDQDTQDRIARAVPAALGMFADAGYAQGIRTKVEVNNVELT